MMQPGDILAWKVNPSAPLKDRIIGWGESKLKQATAGGYEYYHVAIVSTNLGWMYSAQPPRINLYPIPNPLPSFVEVYRLKGIVDPIRIGDVLDYCDSRRGRRYDFVGVLTFGMIEFGGLEFCSQLTEDAYERYPICLNEKEQFTTPDDIVNSPLLVKI